MVPGYLLSRVLLLVAGLLALRLFPLRPGDGPWPGSPTADWLAALSRWDGKWYLAIARDGYTYHESAASSLNVAPGYAFPRIKRPGASPNLLPTRPGWEESETFLQQASV